MSFTFQDALNLAQQEFANESKYPNLNFVVVDEKAVDIEPFVQRVYNCDNWKVIELTSPTDEEFDEFRDVYCKEFSDYSDYNDNFNDYFHFGLAQIASLIMNAKLAN